MTGEYHHPSHDCLQYVNFVGLSNKEVRVEASHVDLSRLLCVCVCVDDTAAREGVIKMQKRERVYIV